MFDCFLSFFDQKKKWNRCDGCGRFIAYEDFDNGARRELVYPDSEYTVETYETLCEACNHDQQAYNIEYC